MAGDEPQTKEMSLKTVHFQPENKDELFWSSTFLVPLDLEKFSYRYQIVDGKTGEVINDKQRRKFNISTFSQCTQLSFANEKFTTCGQKKLKSDFNFDGQLSYDTITSKIIVGSFPQTKRDVEQLKSLGVTAVLNLQSYEDFAKYSIQWNKLRKHYNANGIHPEHFSMSDMDITDMVNKTSEAAELLDKILKEHSKVYVHCTAGKNRSP
mmetsp:Transcript_15602/g.13334  ORF Transcript_15602/g.13334 Transcript_15602/m.13334 type:complete len:209 (-) Transcript_15602:453-1079(-)